MIGYRSFFNRNCLTRSPLLGLRSVLSWNWTFSHRLLIIFQLKSWSIDSVANLTNLNSVFNWQVVRFEHIDSDFGHLIQECLDVFQSVWNFCQFLTSSLKKCNCFSIHRASVFLSNKLFQEKLSSKIEQNIFQTIYFYNIIILLMKRKMCKMNENNPKYVCAIQSVSLSF